MIGLNNPGVKKLWRKADGLAIQADILRDITFRAHKKREKHWGNTALRRIDGLVEKSSKLLLKISGFETPGKTAWKTLAVKKLAQLQGKLLYFKHRVHVEKSRRRGTLWEKGFSLTRGLREHNAFFRTNLSGEIKYLLGRKRMQTPGEPPVVRVLDLSVGEGRLLKQLKHEFGERVLAHGVGLTSPSIEGEIDRLFIGDALSKHARNKFVANRQQYDVIVCRRGLAMGANVARLRRVVLPKLAEGGTALLEIGPLSEQHYSNLVHHLGRDGLYAIADAPRLYLLKPFKAPAVEQSG